MINEILNLQFVKITASSPLKNAEFEKITVRPVVIKGKNYFQAERFKQNKVFHLNVEERDFADWAKETLINFSQVCIFTAGKTITYFSGKGKTKRSECKNDLKGDINLSNNREKEYILKEGENIPPLVDLGVFTQDFKIVKAKYDKYKQINR